jgi:hypothetical protein
MKHRRLKSLAITAITFASLIACWHVAVGPTFLSAVAGLLLSIFALWLLGGRQ